MKSLKLPMHRAEDEVKHALKEEAGSQPDKYAGLKVALLAFAMFTAFTCMIVAMAYSDGWHGAKIKQPLEDQTLSVGSMVSLGTYRAFGQDDYPTSSDLVFTGATTDGRASFARKDYSQAWTETYSVGTEVNVRSHSGRGASGVFIIKSVDNETVRLQLVSWTE